ncbi:MAG: DUF6701 domain-containing protein, partial [Polaromonas sp.]
FSVTPAAPQSACRVHPIAVPGYVPTDFTYFSQPDGFATPFTLTALNQSDAPTKNYIGLFARISATGWSWTNTLSADGLRFGTSAPLLAGSILTAATQGGFPAVPSGSWSNGATALTSVKHQVSRPTAIAGETAITITALPLDPDGVTMAAAAAVSTSPTALRFGRIRVQNAYGSERLALPVPVHVQYWNGSIWAGNVDDSCTALSVPAIVTLGASAVPLGAAALYFYPISAKNKLISTDTVPTTTAALVGGSAIVNFPAPINPGWLDIILGVPDYLQFNWGNCMGQTGTVGLLDDRPCARATFGIYRSPLIYHRENY